MSNLLSALGVVDAVRKPASTNQDVIGYAAESESMQVLRPFRPDGRVLESALPGVSHEAWTDFVFAMKVAPLDAVSQSNGLGMFDIRYKRLADLNLVTNLRYKRDVITNRSVQVADWVKPLTKEKFLKSASAQYKVFVASMVAYYNELRTGAIPMPAGMTASGALAILHRGGRSALAKWSDPDQRFESTANLFRAANGAF